MTAAIFGLVGVFVGGVLNGVVASVMSNHNDARALMAGARLVLEDLASIRSTSSFAVESKTWTTIPDYALPTDQWDEYRTLFASRVKRSPDWRKLAAPFSDAHVLSTLAQEKQRHQPLSDGVASMFTRAVERSDVAIEVIAPFVRGEHLWWWRFKHRLRLVRPGHELPPPPLDTAP